MKTFGGEQESAGDAGLAWGQVKDDECREMCLSGFSVGQNSSCRLLDILEIIWGFGGEAGGIPLQWSRPEVAEARLRGFAIRCQMS